MRALLVALASFLFAEPAAPCPVVFALETHGGVVVHAGEADGVDGACLPSGAALWSDTPSPVLTRAVALSGNASVLPLPRPVAGLSFVHSEAAWSLRWTPGSPWYELLPISGELGLIGQRVQRADDVVAMTVAPSGKWAFVIVEASANGDLLARRFEALGTAGDMELAGEMTVATGWPSGSRLLGTSASEGGGWAWALSPARQIHVTQWPTTATVPAPLTLEAGALIAAGSLGDALVLVTLASGRMSSRILAAGAWSDVDTRPWEGQWTALAASSGGMDDGQLTLVASDGSDISWRSLADGQWTEARRSSLLDDGLAPIAIPANGNSPTTALPNEPRSRTRPLLVLVAIASVACVLGLAAFLWKAVS